MLHDPKDLISNHGSLIFNTLVKLKKNKIIKKIGISCYSLNDLEKIIKLYKIDLVQLPFNIFDQRIINNSILKKLKKKKY